MRQVPQRAWLAAAFVAALAAGCHTADVIPDDMPGETPASFCVREAPDAADLVILPPPPPPRNVVPARLEQPALLPEKPTDAAAIYWDVEPAAGPPAQLDAPRALTSRRVAVSDGVFYAHAQDHHWLVGALVYESSQRRWSIRYTSPGEADRYGGQLELIGTGPMTGFCTGQAVRVDGELVDPQPFQVKPAFRVRSLQTFR